MPENEQIPGEVYKAGQKIKVYILEVKKTNKGPQIVVSRSHPVQELNSSTINR